MSVDDKIFNNSALVFVSVVGSKLLGTDTEDSDTDIQGVLLPPEEYLLGLEHVESIKPSSACLRRRLGVDAQDITFYTMKKFCDACKRGGPSIVQLLLSTPIMLSIDYYDTAIKIGKMFLDPVNVRASAIGMTKSVISRTERLLRWTENPPYKERPTPESFGAKIVDGRPLWKANSKDRAAYKEAVKEWTRYTSFLNDVNPKNLSIIQEVGYDVKAVAHAVIACAQSVEFLNTGSIMFPLRTNILAYVRPILAGEANGDEAVALMRDHMRELITLQPANDSCPQIDKANRALVNMHAKYLSSLR